MEKGLLHYLLVLVCSKENNAPRLAEEHLERDTSCTNKRTMAQRSLNANIYFLGHKDCCGGASCQPAPWSCHAWEHTDHPPEMVFRLSKAGGNHCSYIDTSRALPFLVM